MSTITLDSRNETPKVHYATAIDWFVIMSFVFVIATLLEFAGVHYFTKIGSGEMYEADAASIVAAAASGERDVVVVQLAPNRDLAVNVISNKHRRTSDAVLDYATTKVNYFF